jgi:DNA-binding beta-propeller fold protein YncE
MPPRPRRRFWFLIRTLSSFALSASCLRAAVADAPPLQVRVLAGSGAAGIQDGPAATATFLMPAQVAYDKRGTVYVVGSAAERIRSIGRDGAVRTVAGGGAIGPSGTWVAGDYRDGPAADARFRHPDGIAVAPNGTLYVVDRDNRCIRAISGGVVSTFAGTPGMAGSADGARGTGRFASPIGARVCAASHPTARSAPCNSAARRDRATGITLSRAGPVTELDVADALGIVRVMLPSLKATRIAAFPTGTKPGGAPLAGYVPLGVPHTIAAFSPGEVVFTDLRDSSVKYLRLTSYLRYLGVTPAENAMTGGGGSGFDGALPRYDAPMGIATDARGSIAVADTGNRRVLEIAPFERGAFLTADTFDKLNFAPHQYRVAVVGSSYTWFNSSAQDSIAGLLETKLRTVAALTSRPPSTRYFQIGRLSGEFDLLDNVLGFGAADLVVFVLSPIDPEYGLGLGSDPAAWSPVVHRRLQASVATLRTAHVAPLVAIAPAPQALSPLEAANLFEGVTNDPESDYESAHQALLDAIAGIEVPVVDLYPAFRAELAKPDRRPLFSTSDIHYSPYGREVAAGAIFAELQRLEPLASH